MTGVLEQLRDVNPVDPSSVRISPDLRRRALAAPPSHFARHRRSLTLGVLAVAAAVVFVLLIVIQGGSSDLAARAYAATTGPGVIHWRTDLVSAVNGKVGSRQRVEGWARNGVTHELRYDVVHGKAILQAIRDPLTDARRPGSAPGTAFSPLSHRGALEATRSDPEIRLRSSARPTEPGGSRRSVHLAFMPISQAGPTTMTTRHRSITTSIPKPRFRFDWCRQLPRTRAPSGQGRSLGTLPGR